MLVLIFGLSLTGCIVRTYTITKERLDQDIAGNRGYIQGGAPALETKDRSSTRETVVVELELGSPVIFGKPKPKTYKEARADLGYLEDAEEPATRDALQERQFIVEEDLLPVVEEEPTFVQYKVQSGDTLQKISKKFYGTYRKWQKIYDANRNKLKNPDAISPGLILDIPEE